MTQKNVWKWYIFWMIVCLIFWVVSAKMVLGYNEGVPTTVGFGTANLYSYWTFDVNTTADWGGYTANMQSLNFNSSGKINAAADFDGNHFINYTGLNEFPTKPITILWWGKYDSLSNTGYMWGDICAGSSARFFTRQNPSNFWDGGTWNGASYWPWGTPVPKLTYNFTGLWNTNMTEWVFYTHVINSTGSFWNYVNGANYSGTNQINLTSYAGLACNFIVGNRQALDRDYSGLIDEFMTFNTVLTATQVQTVYNDSKFGVRPYDNVSTPTALVFPSMTNTSLYITWTNPTDRVFNHTGLYYNYSGASSLVFISNETGTSKNITGLTPNTTYWICIFSYAHNNKNTTAPACILNTTEAGEPEVNGSNYSQSIPYFNDFEVNMSKWRTVFNDTNICSGTLGAPAYRTATVLKQESNSTYYNSPNTTLFTTNYSAHAYTNLSSPVFILNGSAVYISFYLRVKSELNYDGMAIFYRYNESGQYQNVTNQSFSGVYFTKSPYSTYLGYGGHGTSTTSCMANAFSSQDTGLLKINLTGIPATGNLTLLFRIYADINTICTSGKCGVYIDDFNITYNMTEAGTDSCTYSGSGEWNILCEDNCDLTTNTELNGNNITVSGSSGSLSVHSYITGWKRFISYCGMPKVYSGRLG